MEYTKQQIDAINSNALRILVLACAGSGKTSLLVGRINRLLEEGAKEEELLALTFSNKAAKEMRERINRLLPDHASKIAVKTFHSFGLEIINSYYNTLGFPSRVSIVLRDEASAIVKNIFKRREEKGMEGKDVLRYIKESKSHESYTKIPALEEITREYAEELKALSKVDMDDMIHLPLCLFEQNAFIRDLVRKQYKYIFVDEYQDTSEAQNQLLLALSGEDNHLFLVGDDDQAIYEWRGAKPCYIIEKAHDPSYEVLRLEKNFRSQGLVIDIAAKVITLNKQRAKKTLQKDREDGLSPVYKRFRTKEDEAEWVASSIEKLIASERFNPSDIAVLARNNRQLEVISAALEKRRIAYESMEVEDSSRYISFVRVLKSICDMSSLETLGEALNFPSRCFDQFAFEDAKSAYCDEYGQQESYDALTWVHKLYLSSVPFESDELFRERYGLIAFLHEATSWSSSQRIAYYVDYLKRGGYDKTHPEQFSMVLQCFDIASNYEREFGKTDLSAFVEHLIISYENDDAETGINIDAVNLLTIHRAKGLEFKAVFLIGVQVGVFPNDYFVKTEYDLECERRLFYVALTRAKEVLYLSSYADPLGGSMSNPILTHGFLAEIPRVYFGEEPDINRLRSFLPRKEAGISTKARAEDAEESIASLARSLPQVEEAVETKELDGPATLSNLIEIPSRAFVVIVGGIEMRKDVLRAILKKNSFPKGQYEWFDYDGSGFHLEKYCNNFNCLGLILGPQAHKMEGIDAPSLKGKLLNEPDSGYPYFVDLIERRITKTSLQEALQKIKMHYRELTAC